MTEQKLEQKDMGLEERFEALDAILAEMEKDDVTLERSFALYQQGLSHVKAANDSIEAIEKKLLVLNEDGKVEEF